MEHIVAAYARKKFRMTKYHVKSQLLDWIYINIQMNRGRDRRKMISCLKIGFLKTCKSGLFSVSFKLKYNIV